MEGGSRVVRWQDEVKMENLDQFVMETAPQVSPMMIMMMAMMERGGQQVKMNRSSTIPIAIMVILGNSSSLAGLAIYSDRGNFNVGE